MTLYEEGHFQLDDPISKFIPEFKNPKVLVPGDNGAEGKLVPASREITIRHLLTHTSGLTYQWDPRVGPKYSEAGITHGLLQDEGIIGDGPFRICVTYPCEGPRRCYSGGGGLCSTIQDYARRSLSETTELPSAGSYRWGGFWYTTFFVEPSEHMIGVCMAQLYPSGKATLNDQFEPLARQAIVDSK